ncbi:hypothetical protein CAR_c18340 [Carnobacterium sp. 17-4]|nr:hypothetical protein CAR_c18340 [Carnobacterium sp. 17-4]
MKVLTFPENKFYLFGCSIDPFDKLNGKFLSNYFLIVLIGIVASSLGDSFISRKIKSSIEKKEIIKKALDPQSKKDCESRAFFV